LPPIDATRKTEHLLVRYDRVSSGNMAWLRVSVADVPTTITLKSFVSARTPGTGWKHESPVEELAIASLPAARLAWTGRWERQDYRCETVAVRKADKVYFIVGSYPAADSAAQELVRQAIAGAAWQ
jgi:hypothetical protein